eukprot:c17372_g1_i3.p1 GENE.c17372_g1_i3~~c17372_g1_i3.p1  ORF type:complete len:140 (+),score=35.41 c17372_g1_i3:163-582(+)
MRFLESILFVFQIRMLQIIATVLTVDHVTMFENPFLFHKKTEIRHVGVQGYSFRILTKLSDDFEFYDSEVTGKKELREIGKEAMLKVKEFDDFKINDVDPNAQQDDPEPEVARQSRSIAEMSGGSTLRYRETTRTQSKS